MTENYGRRVDDIMLPDLDEEVSSHLTESQKINIKVLQNLTSLNTAVNDVQHDVNIHQKLLITGNGTPSLQERLRNVETFVDTIRYRGRFVGGAILLQTLAFGGAVIFLIVKAYPLLEKLASKP